MQILRPLFVVAAAVVPLAFAIPAEARGELTYGELTYTCDTVMVSGRAVFGEANCVAANGIATNGLIVTESTFFIKARTGDKLEFRCYGGNVDKPGGYVDTPASVTGNDCTVS